MLNGESCTALLLKGVSTHSSIDNVDEESKSTSLRFTNSYLFQPNAGVSAACPKDTAMCKSVEQCHTDLNDKTSSYSIVKLKGSLILLKMKQKTYWNQGFPQA